MEGGWPSWRAGTFAEIGIRLVLYAKKCLGKRAYKDSCAYIMPKWYVLQTELWKTYDNVSTYNNARLQHFEDLQSLDGVSFSSECSVLLLQFIQKKYEKFASFYEQLLSLILNKLKAMKIRLAMKSPLVWLKKGMSDM